MSIQDMLRSLIEGGWSQSALARELKTSQPTVHRLVEKAQDPSYQMGKRIEALYVEQQKEKKAA